MNKPKMIKLVRQLVVMAMLVVAAAGAFAQGKGQGKRPPKEPAKVIENRKENPPPPKNDRPKQDKPKKP